MCDEKTSAHRVHGTWHYGNAGGGDVLLRCSSAMRWGLEDERRATVLSVHVGISIVKIVTDKACNWTERPKTEKLTCRGLVMC